MAAAFEVQKTIFLIRHGRSEHNEAELAHIQAGHTAHMSDPFCFDARLSPTGEEQARGLRAEVLAGEVAQVELVVVSPLSRAIQTCLYAFDPSKVPILVMPLCREKVENACDLGRVPHELRSEFPGLDFRDLHPELWWYIPDHVQVTREDYQRKWKTHRYEEPASNVNRRVATLKEWLRLRPESKIAVVGHSNFFLQFTGMTEKLRNCEIYKLHI